MPVALLAAQSSPWSPMLVGFGICVLLLGGAALSGLWFDRRARLRREEAERQLRKRLLARGLRARAMVVFHAHENGKYFPKVKFETPDGQVWRHRASRFWKAPWPPVGTKVDLAYDALHPETAVVIEWPANPAEVKGER